MTTVELALTCAVLCLIVALIALATLALDLRAQRDRARETLGHLGVRSFRVATGVDIRVGQMAVVDPRGLVRAVRQSVRSGAN